MSGIVKFLFLFFFLQFCAVESSAQMGSSEKFGKNRVQYHDDFDSWTKYKTAHFNTFWYGKSRRIGIMAAQIAEYDHEEIRGLLEHRMNEKIDLIVYSDITDLKQTNIGNSDLFQTASGETKIIGNKLFVYFNGSHSDLREGIRNGVSRVYLYQMLLGSNWQQFFEYLSQTEFPEWYLKGVVEYLTSGWDREADDELRAYFLGDYYKHFYQLARDHPDLAGQMFWYFITQKYGNSVIANVMYYNRINKSLDNSFKYIIGKDLERLVQDAWNNYQLIYTKEESFYKAEIGDYELNFKNRFKSQITDIEIHPSGDYFTFVTNENGRWSIYNYDLNTGKKKKILRSGVRNPFQETDTQYPMLRWSDSGDSLYIIYEQKDVISLRILDSELEKIYDRSIPNDVQRVYSFDIVDSDRLIFSAMHSGRSDLLLYNFPKRRSKPLNGDVWDDLSVSYGKWLGKKGVFFSSNRSGEKMLYDVPSRKIPSGKMDIFFLALEGWSKKDQSPQRISNTPEVSEIELNFHAGNLYYLAEGMGKLKLMKHVLKGENEVLASYVQNFRVYDINEKVLLASMRSIDRELLYEIPADSMRVSSMSSSTLVRGIMKIVESKQSAKKRKQITISGPPPRFQSEFSDNQSREVFAYTDTISKREENPELDMDRLLSLRDTSSYYLLGTDFKRNRAIASRLHFKTEGVEMDLSNELLYNGLESYTGIQNREYQYQEFGLLFKSRVYDIFEDYEFHGAARFPLRFNGSEYALTFLDKKKRWDKIYGYYRKARRYQNGSDNRPIFNRDIYNIITFEMRYPFNPFNSVRLRSTLRWDKVVPLVTSSQNLENNIEKTQRIGLRAEYVYDNTYDLQYNMKVGFRAKAYLELMNRFQIQNRPWVFSPSDALMTLAGFDARHYLRLNRAMILASRLSGSTSFGNEQILFLMGGVENWLFRPPNQSQLGIPSDGNFAYRALAAPMRGFTQNARNGSTYALGNLELRVCPFNYFSKRELKSKFFKNLMLLGFVDVGTAWYGFSPYDPDNPLNEVFIEESTLEGVIRYYRDPILLGYGLGARFYLYGFHVGIDRAWGIDTKERTGPQWYFSLGKDF